MPVSPRAFSARTRLEPINPAAPVTTISMAVSGKEFFGMNHRGTKLAYDNARSLVGQFYGLGEGGACRKHDAQNGNYRIPRSADIVHFPRDCRNVEAFAFAVQRHALFAARNQQRIQAELAAQLLRAPGQVVLALPAPGDFTEFRPVRRKQRSVLVARIVVAFGIDKYRFSRRARRLDHAFYMPQPALAVVGQDDEVGISEPGLEIRELRQQDFVTGFGFEIDTQ